MERVLRARSAVSSRSVVVMCMPEIGHFRRLRPIIRGLSGRGLSVHVFTHRRFAVEVERAQGIFEDMFGPYPLEVADDASIPIPLRFVTYAARFAEGISRDVGAVAPSLLIHDTFTVIGRVVADRLGIPRVSICPGHNVAPERFAAILREDPRVRIAPACREAVEVLRAVYGMEDASPFCYVSSLSPTLNLYCEPPEFLQESERAPFAPIAFFGSIPAPEDAPWPSVRSRVRANDEAWPRTVYIAFGTVIWRSWRAEALSALRVLATTLTRAGNLRTVIGLGGASIAADERAALDLPNVSVEPYVDQWQILQKADIFVTHHGLNSTHEAIFCGVPMISYPIFWDQPALAARCQQFGLAHPLCGVARGKVAETDVRAALEAVAARREQMHAALARAREWEMAVIEQRPAVLEQVIRLLH